MKGRRADNLLMKTGNKKELVVRVCAGGGGGGFWRDFYPYGSLFLLRRTNAPMHPITGGEETDPSPQETYAVPAPECRAQPPRPHRDYQNEAGGSCSDPRPDPLCRLGRPGPHAEVSARDPTQSAKTGKPPPQLASRCTAGQSWSTR